MRISRDALLMEIAVINSKRGTCERMQTGAILVRDGRVISTGYNGPVSGAPHCDSLCDTSKPCFRSVHAEANAIVFAARHGVATEGCSMYTMYSPCFDCAKLIINAGITEVYYEKDFRDLSGVGLLRKVNVTCYSIAAAEIF